MDHPTDFNKKRPGPWDDETSDMKKPIDVVKELVEENPNDMQLGELVRQYIMELIRRET